MEPVGEKTEGVVADVGVDVTEEGGGLDGDVEGVNENGEDGAGGKCSALVDVEADHAAFDCEKLEEPDDDANMFGPLILANGELEDEDAYAINADCTFTTR